MVLRACIVMRIQGYDKSQQVKEELCKTEMQQILDKDGTCENSEDWLWTTEELQMPT